MPPDVVISARGLTKTYRLFGHPGDRVKQFLSLGLRRYHREFTALRDVTFEIRKGETIGIVGRNGSGKSTLLQLVCGILKPSSGSIEVNGRISALLELGAGFNPEFTGRENIYFQGALMGFTKTQTDGRFDRIAAFADIGEFIDQPVRTYSSGMFVRLAFSVSIHVAPDILIVDEALGVGDYAFQSKCIDFFHKFHEQGGTTLLVSHDLNAIRSLCNSGIHLTRDGRCDVGPADRVIANYLRETQGAMLGNVVGSVFAQEKSTTDGSQLFKVNADFAHKVEPYRSGSGEARITEFELLDEAGQPLIEATFGQCAIVRMHIRFISKCEVLAAYYIRDDRHTSLLGSSTLLDGAGLLNGNSGSKIIVEFRTEMPLSEGHYTIQAQLATPIIPNTSSTMVDYVENAAQFTVVQRSPLKIWSKVYVRNSVEITEVKPA